MESYDKIIIGAGLYGLYSAARCGERGEKILVLEYDQAPFMRATYINQARVHMGYHYPRSLSTAKKSAGYYQRFHQDFGFSVNGSFEQIYATSSEFSWTDAGQFMDFCRAAGIRCEEVPVAKFFRAGACDGAFLTEEDTYDARVLCEYFMDRIRGLSNVTLVFSARLGSINRNSRGRIFEVEYASAGSEYHAAAPFVLNATYASTNQVLAKACYDSENGDMRPFAIKYELCEIILLKPSEKLSGVGLTVMDGPFFSIMPFGKTGYHSLTSVTFTPHISSHEELPVFTCQTGRTCTPQQLENCNTCPGRPETAWPYMSHLADKYLLPEYTYTYEKSLFSVKPILKSSEVDDSRPTAIRVNSRDPVMISVLSGKINTVYDLDPFLDA